MRVLRIGDIVKHKGKFAKVIGYQAHEVKICAVLEERSGLVALVPVSKIYWTGKQWKTREE